MARRARQPRRQGSLLDARVTTAPCRAGNPQGRRGVAGREVQGRDATRARLLLNHWFETDHRLPGWRRFPVLRLSARRDRDARLPLRGARNPPTPRSLEKFAPNIPGIHVLQYDDFARYAIKMATGSGKTKVMSLAIAWQYFNAVAEGRDDYARSFLVVAPNVIVFERLRADFAAGGSSGSIPSSRRSCASSGTSSATCAATPSAPAPRAPLYLTNIQQFYDAPIVSRPGRAGRHDGRPRAKAAAHDDHRVDAFDDRIVARACSVPGRQRRRAPHPRRGQRVEPGHPTAQ